ncbi:MAG: hypothetical protein IIU14_03195 [Ruminococcus sp.]|nr:hypothetical protein [Ruminococcus sp.]
MKNHKLKPRYIFLIISFSVILIGYLIYSVSVGQSYSISESVGGLKIDMNTVKVECSNENVIKVSSVTKSVRDDEMTMLNIDVESKSSG